MISNTRNLYTSISSLCCLFSFLCPLLTSAQSLNYKKLRDAPVIIVADQQFIKQNIIKSTIYTVKDQGVNVQNGEVVRGESVSFPMDAFFIYDNQQPYSSEFKTDEQETLVGRSGIGVWPIVEYHTGLLHLTFTPEQGLSPIDNRQYVTPTSLPLPRIIEICELVGLENEGSYGALLRQLIKEETDPACLLALTRLLVSAPDEDITPMLTSEGDYPIDETSIAKLISSILINVRIKGAGALIDKISPEAFAEILDSRTEESHAQFRRWDRVPHKNYKWAASRSVLLNQIKQSIQEKDIYWYMNVINLLSPTSQQNLINAVEPALTQAYYPVLMHIAKNSDDLPLRYTCVKVLHRKIKQPRLPAIFLFEVDPERFVADISHAVCDYLNQQGFEYSSN